jgi:hypothetical protein
LCARILDDGWSIPGTRWRIGIDPLLGLFPAGGDTLGFLVGLYIPYCAHRLACPKSLIGRMLGNLVIDAIVSAIPVLGDLFDFAFKANRRNVELLRSWMDSSATSLGKP